jgi:hypothetical protein
MRPPVAVPRGWPRAAARDPASALARQGKRVAVLEPATYGGYKDVNEAGVAGALTIGD